VKKKNNSPINLFHKLKLVVIHKKVLLILPKLNLGRNLSFQNSILEREKYLIINNSPYAIYLLRNEKV